MKKACPYCGKVHDKNYTCPNKPLGKYRHRDELSREDIFRGSYEWKLKRKHIIDRDHICLACYNRLPGTIKRINSEELSVHHIRPLKNNFELRLDDENLITLCRNHHEMAEKNEISAEKLLSLIPKTPPQGYNS